MHAGPKSTRRSFLGATAAASAARTLSAAPAVCGGPFDVAIIGAGALPESPPPMRSGNTLEARDPVGGRAYSDNTNIPGIPVDLGAEWFIPDQARRTRPDHQPAIRPRGAARSSNPAHDMNSPRARGNRIGQGRIVTVPLGVLAAGRPAFDPLLPSQHTDAFARLPMGRIEKYWLQYSENIFGAQGDNFGLRTENVVAGQLIGTTPGYQFRWFGSNVIGVIIGGDIAEGVGRLGRAGAIDYARQAVAAVFGSSTLDKFQSAAVSQWLLDPYSQGAYTAAVPGGVPARALLRAKQPRPRLTTAA